MSCFVGTLAILYGPIVVFVFLIGFAACIWAVSKVIQAEKVKRTPLSTAAPEVLK